MVRKLIARLVAWTGFKDKTLWDWMKLLIIPITLFGASVLLNTAQDERQRQLEDDRASVQATVEADRANANALQAYYDKMAELILTQELKLESVKGKEAQSIARARTLATLRALDDERKGSLLRFLYESGLVGYLDEDGNQQEHVIRLVGADLSRVDLFRAYLDGARLGAADLSGANLSEAILRKADLFGADLSRADLFQAYLSGPSWKGPTWARPT